MRSIKKINSFLLTLNLITKKNNAVKNSDNNHHDLPTRNIKITITILEREIENWKLRHERLQKMFQNSEKICRYMAIKYSKYLPILNELGLFFLKKN